MFDKNLLLQHISNRQRTVEQMLSEAKEGELHGRLRQAISKYYGIDPDHENWSKIKPHADIERYANNVYDYFPREIDKKFISDPNTPSSARLQDQNRFGDILDDKSQRVAEMSAADFIERVGDMHHMLTKKKPKKD